VRIVLAALLGLAAIANGQEIPPDIVLRDAVDIAYRQPLTFALPDRADLEGEGLYLSFSARIEAGELKSGSAPCLQVSVNGLPTSLERLRNKPQYYFFTPERRVRWFSPADSAWVLPYYPWERKDVAAGFVHAFVLDISDLLRDTNNTLTLESLYSYVPDAQLQLRDVRLLQRTDFPRDPRMDEPDVATESRGMEGFRRRALGYHRGAEAKLNTDIAYEPRVGIVRPRESFAQEFAHRLDDTGRIHITVGSDRYQTTSWFRTPGGEWLGIGGDEDGWDSRTVQADKVTCTTSHLALLRSVIRRASHLEIRDHVTNRTGGDLPIALVNAVDVGAVGGLREFRIAGQLQGRFWASTSPMVGRQLGATPVVYAERDASALGVVLGDDAYRNQGSVMVWDSTIALGDDMFYLSPGGEYTFVWKLYPLAQPDYYVLVNALRHDWNLFQHIPGLFGFVHPSSKERMYEDVRCEGFDEIAEWLRDTGIDITASSAMLDMGPDKPPAPLYGNEQLEVIRKGLDDYANWREEVHRRGVEVPCLPYVNPHLCRLVGGRTLDDLEQRLPGCLVRDAYGTPVAYRAGWLYCVLPTLDNPVGKHLLEVLRLYLDERKFEGIYLDEWDHSRARVSFSHEDGISALLDADGRLLRKVAFVPIIAKEFQVNYVREMTQRNAIIFANQFDDTLTAAQLPIIHFAEPGGSYDEYLLCAAQCSRTPMALHVKRTQGIWQDAKEFLKRGLLMCYYWKYLHGDHVLKRYFPITVRELWPGVIVGEDRIITCASGTFTLGREKPLTAYIYSGPAGELSSTVEGNAEVDGHAAVELELTDDQIAVVMEQP